MAKPVAGVLVRVVRAAAVDAAVSDRDLLGRYAASGDQAAFAAVARRHTAMVFGVCRRVLHNPSDAEDACQAVFLILAKKAKSVRWQASAANWLYATARKVAHNARLAAARRARREGAAAVAEAVSPADAMTGRELMAALDEELDRLPPRYREPLVLCYLEGLTRDEAAARLGVPDATLKSQLERGRRKLADALTARGCALGAALLTAAATSPAGASPPRLLESILAGAGGSPSAPAAALAEGVVVNGIGTKAKLMILSAVCAAALGFGFAALPTAAGPQKPAPDKMEKPAAKADAGRGSAPGATAKDRTITGRVLGPDGKPAAAELFLLWLSGSPESLGRTNTDGTFRVTVPLKDPGAFLVAKADGHGIDFTMPARNTPAEVMFKLPKDNPIRGRVIDTQGHPVAGATVTPRQLFDFAGGTAATFLDEWKTRHPQSGLRGGQNDMWLIPEVGFSLPDGRTLLAAKTDADGRFEIAGIGAERVVTLSIRSTGIADTEVYVVNREKFDPDPVNRAASDNRARMLPKGMKIGLTAQLYGPTPTVIAEQEKVIRGVVTDRDTGKPRAGVEVLFARVSDHELLGRGHRAKTDKDGRFEIRGSRKYERYVIETPADTDSGYLPCQAEAWDTVGYEPIAVEIGCAKGVIVSGRMTDKGTGEPVAGHVLAMPMHDNPFVAKYPTMDRSASGPARQHSGIDGTFRIVTVPGPVLLMAGPARHDTLFHYKPPRPDPKFPKYFNTALGGALGFYTRGGGQSFVQGCWCKVLEVKAADTAVVQDIELEPSSRTPVRFADADGQPVAGCEVAGLGWKNWSYPIHQETDTATAYGIEPKDERLIAAGHTERRLVGTAVVKAGDKDPVVTLGPGGSVSGRVTDETGKPVEGVIVRFLFDQREVAKVFGRMTPAGQAVTDAKGGFRFGTLAPGYKFRLMFGKGKSNVGPGYDQARKYQIKKHGESTELGDLKVQTLGGE